MAKNMTNMLIVSKDRALQLDLLLRSMADNFKVPHITTIIYTYSDNLYKKGYDILINEYPHLKFVKETNFREDVLNTLSRSFKYHTALCDDCVFPRRLERTKEFNIFDANTDILALNYRIGPNMKVVYQGEPETPLPVFTKDHIWNWQTAKTRAWKYSMALAGQFYRMVDMVDYLPHLNFDCPTFIETRMMQNQINKPLQICFDESKIIALEINRVQDRSLTNKHGNITAEYLNNQWLDGMRIRKESVYCLPTEINRFFNVKLEFEER